MNAETPDAVDFPQADARMLSFEVAGSLYALPVASVLEVTEVDRVGCIPMLPTHIGGVINYHGDALPIVSWASLFDDEYAPPAGPGNILVITDRTAGSACIGLPIDHVRGLIHGDEVVATGDDAIAERRSVDGRVASVLDPKRLVAQARETLEASLGRGG